jgi:D-3-phosphoglycerate dehydrogenase / 2-oxoglutarate reductase
MNPTIVIAFGENGDTIVEEQVLKQINASVIYTKTIKTPEALEIAKTADAIAVSIEPYTSEIINSLKNCKIICRFGTGLDNIDLEAAARAGIWVTNVPDAYVEEVSTHAVALLLACNRRLIEFNRSTHQGHWENQSQKISRLRGQTLGLLGFGLIAKSAAAKAQGLGLNVFAHDPYVEASVFMALNVRQVGFEDLLQSSDYLSLHVPATNGTRGIINSTSLRLMKPGAYLINTARGVLIDEDALLAAVQNGQIQGAALDVRVLEPPPEDDPLKKEERIILTPHLAWCSLEAAYDLRIRASMEIVRVLKGEKPLNPANQPDLHNR